MESSKFMDKFIDFCDSLRDNSIHYYKKAKFLSTKYSKIWFNNAISNKGITILILVILLTIITENYILVPLWGSVLYGFLLLTNFLRYKEQKEIDSHIDLDKFLDIENLMDKYIENCYIRDVALYVVKENEYVSEKEQMKELELLMNSVAANMSKHMRRRLELYCGTDNVDKILTRKCYIYVSLNAATNNKVLYKR